MRRTFSLLHKHIFRFSNALSDYFFCLIKTLISFFFSLSKHRQSASSGKWIEFSHVPLRNDHTHCSYHFLPAPLTLRFYRQSEIFSNRSPISPQLSTSYINYQHQSNIPKQNKNLQMNQPRTYLQKSLNIKNMFFFTHTCKTLVCAPFTDSENGLFSHQCAK